MRKMRFCLASMTAITVAMATPPVSAASLGAAGGGAVLGQALDFAVPYRHDSADSPAPDCVSAEVTVGDRRLPSAQVSTVVDLLGNGNARIRVLTTRAIDEPVIGVQLSVGCQANLSRSYVVLVDPPGLALPARSAVVAAPSFAWAPAEAEAAAAMPVASVPPKIAAPRSALRAQRRAKRRAATPRPPDAASWSVRGTAAAAVPARLKLEVSETTASAEAVAIQRALEAVAEAASAAQASMAAASATAARIAMLERTADSLHKEAWSSRDEAAQLREQLARADGAGRWMAPLMALVVLLTGLAAWLAWRLSSRQGRRQRGWIEATEQPGNADDPLQPSQNWPPGSSAPFVTSRIHAPAPEAPKPAVSWMAPGTSSPVHEPVEEPPDRSTMRTEVLPQPVRPPDLSLRDVSIEELIDLEQQAEFFAVLGQDEAAIDLLVQHLRDTGGGSPLPYLKLLEIQHRRGDRDAYERTRTRFNQRFNAYAPEWGQDMRAGRALEDYPGVLPRLQQVWPRPLDAMVELEALLFRKSGGELFDLPAYREVLFLYSLARDLLDREPVDSRHVDLLLPLADGGEAGTAAVSSWRGADHDGFAAYPEPGDRSTAAVDVDLTQAAPTTSIFDAQDLPPPGSRP